MKSYLKPLQGNDGCLFKSDATFEDAYSLYEFDSELRKLISGELAKIEISIRTQLSLIMCEEAGIFWFEEVRNFRNSSRHAVLLLNLRKELQRSDDEGIITFQSKYMNSFPPSWITFEISSFGTLSMMYKWLKAGKVRRELANGYGLSDTVMESWLHSIVYIRNLCAHHSRLWNRRLSINAVIPRKTTLPFITIPADTKRLYYLLSIIGYFLQTVCPENTFAMRFKILLSRYPIVDVSAMGFPIGWENEKLWQGEHNCQ